MMREEQFKGDDNILFFNFLIYTYLTWVNAAPTLVFLHYNHGVRSDRWRLPCCQKVDPHPCHESTCPRAGRLSHIVPVAPATHRAAPTPGWMSRVVSGREADVKPKPNQYVENNDPLWWPPAKGRAERSCFAFLTSQWQCRLSVVFLNCNYVLVQKQRLWKAESFRSKDGQRI